MELFIAASAIGNLAVNLTLNTAAFQKGATLAEKRAQAMQGKFQGIGKSLGGLNASLKGIGAGLAVGVGAAAVAGIAAITSNALEMGTALTEAAAKVGVTVEALQEMRYVAEQNGVSVDTMEGSLNKMSRTLGELQMGNTSTISSFKALGLSAQQLAGLTPTDSFIKIAEALNKVEDETVRAALGNKIFGRSYSELKPIIALGAEGIRKAAEEKRRDGIISTEQAATLDDLADGWDRLTGRLGVATAGFIANLAGSTNASDGLDQMGKTIASLLGKFQQAAGLVSRLTIKFHELQRALAVRQRDSALTRFIPGVSEDAQTKINAIDAQIQRLGSKPSTGRVKGTGYRPGGALAGTMASAGTGALSTLEKLEAKAATVGARVAVPVTTAVDKIKLAFDQLKQDAAPLLDRLFPEVKALVDYKANQNTLAAWANAGKISADKLSESLVRLRDSYYGVDGPVAVTQEGGFIDNIVDTLPDLADIGKTTAEKLKAQNVSIVKSFGDTARDVTASITGLANSIKGGGILGILEGVANLFLNLGGAGVFGSKLQANINKPVGRARGGAMTSNRSYLVGERGPEIMTMGGRPGYMTPNNKMNAGGGRQSIQIIPSPYFNVVVDGRADGRVATAAPGIATAAAAGVQTNMQQSNFRTLP